MTTDKKNSDRILRYRKLQSSVPGLESMYALIGAYLAQQVSTNNSLLIIGAGGGREIEMIADLNRHPAITALDPSKANLNGARYIADVKGVSNSIHFVEGYIDHLPEGRKFDVVTSLLVMHNIADRSAKLDYLKGIRKRLKPEGCLLHADVCLEDNPCLNLLKSIYTTHAVQAGTDADLIDLELDAVESRWTLTPDEFSELVNAAGWRRSTELFRTLWYRCWVLQI